MKRFVILVLVLIFTVACGVFTPTPTATPIPTETPVPTSTPDPTVTPSPTPQPTATQDLVIAYKMEIRRRSTDCYPGIQEFAAASHEAAGNTSLLLDPTWVKKAKDAAQRMADACSMIGTMSDVPPSMKVSDDYLKKAAIEFMQAKDDYFKGIDNLDANSIVSSSDHMAQATNYLDLATKSMP
jgi:hypothetical protein